MSTWTVFFTDNLLIYKSLICAIIVRLCFQLNEKQPQKKEKKYPEIVFIMWEFVFLFLILYTLSLTENSGHLSWVKLQQPQEQRYPVKQVHAGPFRVSVSWYCTRSKRKRFYLPQRNHPRKRAIIERVRTPQCRPLQSPLMGRTSNKPQWPVVIQTWSNHSDPWWYKREEYTFTSDDTDVKNTLLLVMIQTWRIHFYQW